MNEMLRHGAVNVGSETFNRNTSAIFGYFPNFPKARKWPSCYDCETWQRSAASPNYSACHVLCKTSDAAQKYISNINTFYFYNFANLLYFVSFICFIYVTVYSCLYFSLIYYRLVVLKACLGWLAVYLEVHLLAISTDI